MSYATDTINTLAVIAPGSDLAAAREVRDAATQNIIKSEKALFDGPSGLSRQERLAIALQVAGWHHEEQLSAYYRTLLQKLTPQSTPRLGAALAHAETLTFHPVKASAEGLNVLKSHGFNAEEIVTLSQIIAFVSFQSRLVRGLRLINGESVAGNTGNALAGEWHTQPRTLDDRAAPVAFTAQELGWTPWLAAKPYTEFSPEEQATLTRFGHQDSDYFRLLGRNLPVLEARTLTDKGIFYTADGLPRAERELAATVASKVNGCIYCASVHARKAGQLSKQPEAIAQLLAVAPGESLSQGQSARWQTEIEFAAALSATPPTAGAAHLSALREQGLDTLALLDLVQSTAFFAWANRLMLTLGEPYLPEA